jgi:hypothetical protein
MGDSCLGIVNDGASALFYNPAALSRIRGLQIEPFNVSAQANNGLFQVLGADFLQVQSYDAYKTGLADRPNIWAGGSYAVTPTVAFQGFSTGVHYENRVRAVQQNGQFRYVSQIQMVPSVGMGFKLASGILRFGYSLQWVHLAQGDVTEAAGTTGGGFNRGLGEGAGFSHNAGFQLTLPYTYLPYLTFVARNIGGVSFSGPSLMGLSSSVAGEPADQKMSVDGAVGWMVKFGNTWQNQISVTARDATNSSSTAWMGRMAGGMEISKGESVFFRGGLASGYPTAGFGVRLRRSDLSLSWFSEEIGDGFRQTRDIRYQLQFRLRFF